MTRRTFGTDLDGTPPPPPAPHPRDALELDAVAEALSGDYEPGGLAELRAIVAAAPASDDPDSPAGRLLAQLDAAFLDATLPPRPPAPPLSLPGEFVPFSVYASNDPGAARLEVLLDGPDGPRRSTVVPAGDTSWRLAEPAALQGELFVGPPAAEG